jgi:Ca2+-transporting ATPase
VVIAIHTKIRGRTRFHIQNLYRSPELKALLESRLVQRPDVFDVRCNVVSGNLLIFYSSNYTHQKIASVIEHILQEAVHLSSSPKTARSRKRKKVFFTRKAASDSRKLPLVSPSVDEQPTAPWHIMNETDIFERLTSRRKGLPEVQVQQRLNQYGANTIPEAETRSGWRIFFDQINSLPVYLLGAAAGVSIFTGGFLDAAIVVGVVLANSVIGYFTESEAEKTIHSLKNIVHPLAVVMRDGRETQIPAEHLVIGDILILKPGGYITADCRILEAGRLTIDESALTGESLPVSKHARALTVENTPLADRKNMAYMGTVVTGGQGLGVIVGTGQFTEIGRLQILLAGTTAPQTPIERQLGQMGDQLVVMCGGICGLVFFLGFLRGYAWLQMLEMAISLAAAAVPEGLPTAATINFSLGISKMKQHRILARHLHAVETLGAVQTICFDKTGTITRNQMTVTRVHAGMRRINVENEQFLLDGETVDPMTFDDIRHIISVSVLCTETKIGDIIRPEEKQVIKSDRYELIGSATENALVHMAMEAGLDVVEHRDTHQIVSLNHRTEEQKYMSSIHMTPEGKR